MSIQRDIDAEVRFHIDSRVEELVAQGLSRDDARDRALAEFGDVDAVRGSLRAIDTRVARRRRRIELLDGVRQDIVYAARSLARAPIISLTIIITLALGLGVNAAMFSLLDVVFLRPPSGVVRPQELRRVWSLQKYREGPRFSSIFDYAGYAAIARAVDGQASAAYYRPPMPRTLGHGENSPVAAVATASANYFPLLGVKPQIGRFYTPDEDRVDVITPVAVVSDAFWRRALDGAPSAIGKMLTLGEQRFTVIGVGPPDFTGTELGATDVWVPAAAAIGPSAPGRKPWWQNPNVNGFQVLIRPALGAGDGELLARTTTALRAPGIGFVTDTLRTAAFGAVNSARGPGTLMPELLVATRLGGVALIVLLIACANVVNLLLARAMKRRREIAVRLALGVSRARLVRLLVTESVLLALAAVVAAVLTSVWSGALLRRLLMPETHFARPPLDMRTLIFALALATAAGVIAGLIPALQSVSSDLTSALKSGWRDNFARRSRLRDALVVIQAALSVILVVGAVLFVRSLRNVKSHDIGYTVSGVMFASPRYDTRDSARDTRTAARLLTLAPRIAALPGVRRVAFTSMRPLSGFSWGDYFPDFDTTGKKLPAGFFTAVSPEYFDAVGTRLLRGHAFEHARLGDPFTLIVDQAMAAALWPNQDAIGHCIHFTSAAAPCSTVIGVAQNTLLNSIHEQPEPHFYVSLDNPPFATWGASDVVVRVDPARLATIQRSLHDLIRDELSGSIPNIITMSRVMEPQYRPWQLGATLFTLFGTLAVCVAAVGIYSTVSYAVSQRTHEFGVRAALGARTADILRQVLGEGLRTVLVGIVIGILMTLFAGRLVASLLYGLSPTDPAAMIAVSAVLMLIAALATFAPAWRAARIDPATALRAE